MSRVRRQARLIRQAEERIRDAMWAVEPADDHRAPEHGLTGLQHARAHRAAMSAERRAFLDGEWL